MHLLLVLYSENDLRVIRPLTFVREKDLRDFAEKVIYFTVILIARNRNGYGRSILWLNINFGNQYTKHYAVFASYAYQPPSLQKCFVDPDFSG